MRLWSIHPKYLDVKGLNGLWREALLAKSIFEGKSKGYINHPQLTRFKNTNDPIITISTYLSYIYNESQIRGYSFNFSKIGIIDDSIRIKVNSEQIQYEFKHLSNKLKVRDKEKFNSIIDNQIEVFRMFEIVDGPIEKWEKIKHIEN
jgi:hypothetical protein